jgi:hypothetical protein
MPVASLPPGLGTAPATTEPLSDRAMQAILKKVKLHITALKSVRGLIRGRSSGMQSPPVSADRRGGGYQRTAIAAILGEAIMLAPRAAIAFPPRSRRRRPFR